MNLSPFQLSPTTRYAFCGMSYLAKTSGERYALVDEVARAEKLPKHFLAKIFQTLTQRGLLRARRGPGGGYALMRQPAETTLLEIVEALEDPRESPSCALANRRCLSGGPCAVHAMVARTRDVMLRSLRKLTLADL